MARSAATLLFVSLAGAFGAGCLDSSNDSLLLTYRTLITVDPSLFRGSLACGAPGLVRYVATLTDVDFDPYRTLPSSPPSRCNVPVSFGENETKTGLIVSHYYIGAIDGYDRDDLTAAAPGDPTMLDSAGDVVLPRWTTTCGEIQNSPTGDAGIEDAPPPYNPLRSATLALGTTEVILRGCLPLAAVPPTPLRSGSSAPEESQNAGKTGR